MNVLISVISSCFSFSGVLCRMFLIASVSSLIRMFVYMFVMPKEQNLVLSSV
jgi:hypothetical protein